ncbi:MAG: hypothetical protein ABI286_07110, partial [Edaphobacter sp.]
IVRCAVEKSPHFVFVVAVVCSSFRETIAQRLSISSHLAAKEPESTFARAGTRYPRSMHHRKDGHHG